VGKSARSKLRLLRFEDCGQRAVSTPKALALTLALATSDSGDVVNLLLVAAIQDSIMGNVNAVRQAGLSPVQVDLIPFALNRALVKGRSAERCVAEVIHETTTELLNRLRNTINYFTNTTQNGPVQAILLTDGGSKLRGLPQALDETTRIQVIPADPSVLQWGASHESSKSLGRRSHCRRRTSSRPAPARDQARCKA
jgi:Tfp pilus assembly PilM family ATPase